MSSHDSLENYTFIKTIGEGTFGKVKLAIHKLTQEKVAIKILEKKKINNEKDLERIKKEIKYLKMLNHPNIVKIYEIIENENNFYISMEYVSGGELFNYIVKNKRLNEIEASFFYSQIIHIIKEIHKHKICHRDLKPENLLLTPNKTIKLIDFGLSNEYEDYLTTPCGSPCYASPEVIKGKKYSGLGIDLWASGIILFSMLCGYLPFDDKNNDELFKKILRCKIEFPKKKSIIISENAKDLIRKILQPEPSKRIKIEEILNHPFLSFGNKRYKEKIKIDINKQDKLIINYMEKIMGISNKIDIIRKNINDNRHNRITTIFYLLKKKYNEGRFDYNKLNDDKNINKMNKVINTEVDYNKNVLLNNFANNDSIDNIIKKKVIKNNNIIIINNNNVLNQQQKMNYLFNPIINDNAEIKKNYEKFIKKIDTSISVEKPRRNNKSPEIIEEKDFNDKKLNEKNVFYKKYINTSVFRDESPNEKIIYNEMNNKYKIFDHKKKIISSLHLKNITDLENDNLNKTKNSIHHNESKKKNNSLIDSFIKTENADNDKRNHFYRRIRISSNLNNKISLNNGNYNKYIDDSRRNEKLHTVENYYKYNRNSVNNRGDKKYIIELINYNDNNISSIDNNNISKENFYKKINLNRLKESNKKIRVNQLTLNDSSIGNNNIKSNIYSYRDNFKKKENHQNHNRVNQTINVENINLIESKRIKFKPKEIMNRSTLNDSITYSKKICLKNNPYSKSNNFLLLSTNLSLYQIKNRLNNFCIQHNLLFQQYEDKYIIILNREDEFMLDIKSNDGSYIIKFTHEKGEESHTKVIMNNLFSEIAK